MRIVSDPNLCVKAITRETRIKRELRMLNQARAAQDS